IAAEPLRLQRGKVGLPARGLLAAELVQIFPGIDAGVVQIVEDEAYGVVADRLDAKNAHMPATSDDLALAGSVALHLRAGALYAKILGGELESRAVVEIYFQALFRALQADFRGRRHQVSSSLRASSGSMIGIPSRIG